jgi:hypothetical protein
MIPVLCITKEASPKLYTMKVKSGFIATCVVALSVLLSTCSKTEDPPQKHLIAHYPLITDGVDSTGLNPSMNLQNTPFENGGIYCNGVYAISSNPDYYLAQTPPINSFKFESFSISMDFFVSEKRTQPVWIIGSSCRWLGFYLYADGTVTLLYNNSNFLTTSKTYSLSEWHNAKISYDGTTANIFLDNILAGSLKFGNGYVPLNYSGCGTSDTEIGTTNYSNGEVFEGYVRNLEVYSPQ